MSVVVWDGRTLAADRQGTNGELRVPSTKLYVLPSGEVIAWTGVSENGRLLMEWYKRGARSEEWPKCQEKDDWTRLIIARAGRVSIFEQQCIEQPIEAEKMAWGAGRDFALGALAMGADAVGAVAVASQYCTSCGMGIDSAVPVELK